MQVRKERASSSVPRRVLLLSLVAASCVSCGKLSPEEKKPTPPPPSEKVPNAPGPDNNIKELSPRPEQQPPSPIKADKPVPPPAEKPGNK